MLPAIVKGKHTTSTMRPQQIRLMIIRATEKHLNPFFIVFFF